MNYTKLDTTISVIRYNLKKRLKRVKEMEKRIDLNENQKIFIGSEYEIIRNVEDLVDVVKNKFNTHLGRIPPQAIDLEETVLGAVMIETRAINYVKSFLKPEHFYHEHHSLIYRACLDLSISNNPLDLKTISEQLRKSGHLETIGGSIKLVELSSKLSSAANIEYHARVIVEYVIKRQLIISCAEVVEESYHDTSDCFELLGRLENSIKEIKSWIVK